MQHRTRTVTVHSIEMTEQEVIEIENSLCQMHRMMPENFQRADNGEDNALYEFWRNIGKATQAILDEREHYEDELRSGIPGVRG